MNALQEKITQFRKMANDDPDNELGHYRLGQLLMEDGQHEEAVKSFRRTLELSPQFSKVYQLLGASLIKLGKRDDAVRALRDGFAVADQRGDNIPRDEMAKLLVGLGETPPQTQTISSRPMAGGPGTFRCLRPGCMEGGFAQQLPVPPMNDEVGRQIHTQVCAACWDYWLKNLSVKVINEMRLDLSTDKDCATYDQIMRETLGLP
ncbi:MAG: tetratricopeptide repeat protein [Planctomycetes bacterium]|nr:tetratricopeptide repeat protein [Planctomycetota bacterium]